MTLVSSVHMGWIMVVVVHEDDETDPTPFSAGLDMRLSRLPYQPGRSAVTLALDQRAEVDLREKDWPIVAGALHLGATNLITGDHRDFGPYLGKRILGVGTDAGPIPAASNA